MPANAVIGSGLSQQSNDPYQFVADFPMAYNKPKSLGQIVNETIAEKKARELVEYIQNANAIADSNAIYRQQMQQAAKDLVKKQHQAMWEAAGAPINYVPMTPPVQLTATAMSGSWTTGVIEYYPEPKPRKMREKPKPPPMPEPSDDYSNLVVIVHREPNEPTN